ncbi:Hypothetical protein NTJ_14188 [Nesidiocoris tenuis]|uniref:Uncharacterized protein n=1 Tax=Nesidiocoris tenuis TaxID=355587 RepID=A0ABN7BE04_9HEMI|nr:Hypothetical protein NTJ_14188 [Nesidiocoris tenuis]
MPSIPQVNNCCFCLTTETGAKIIGWLYTIGGALQAILYLMDLLRILPRVGKEYTTGDAFVIAVMMALAVLICVLGIYLLLGVYKGNHSYVRLWLNVIVIVIIIQLIFFAIRIVMWIMGRSQPDIGVNLLNLLLLIYFAIVVNSYLREHGSGVETF